MKIALFQMKMSERGEDNLKKCMDGVREAAEHGADLIVFPELTLMPFFPQYEKLNVSDKLVTLEDSYVKEFQKVAKECRIITVPNFYLKAGDHTYDASVMISADGEITGVQKMVHIAQAKQFYEQDYYTPSDDGFLVFETPFGKISIVVCFDRHYPESIRTASLKGADLVLVPTANVKNEPLEMFEWEIKVQSYQNCVPIAMCNRVGLEGEMDFAGESLVTDADGKLIIKADDKEQIVYAEIDLAATDVAKKSRPYTNLRRNEMYI